jgi:hypothetical protein
MTNSKAYCQANESIQRHVLAGAAAAAGASTEATGPRTIALAETLGLAA